MHANHPKHALYSLAICLALSSCAAMGEKEAERPTIDGAPIAGSIVFCKTTFSELEKQLGAPSRDGLIHGQRVVSWITEWEPLVRYLGVLLDHDGVVVDMYWNVPSEVQWVPTSQCAG